MRVKHLREQLIVGSSAVGSKLSGKAEAVGGDCEVITLKLRIIPAVFWRRTAFDESETLELACSVACGGEEVVAAALFLSVGAEPKAYVLERCLLSRFQQPNHHEHVPHLHARQRIRF